MDHGQLSMVADKFQWVFSEVAAQRMRHSRKVLSAQADYHAVSLGSGADSDLCQPACRNPGGFPPRLQRVV